MDEAIKAVNNWLNSQDLKNKSHLISIQDINIFAKRYNVDIKELSNRVIEKIKEKRMAQLKDIELNKTLKEIVDLYEHQIVNGGDPEYIIALGELIKERYQHHGVSDYETIPSGTFDDRNMETEIGLFEEKVQNIIAAFDADQPWEVKRRRS